MKCKGGCNQDSIARGWCNDKFWLCPGYKQKLSDKAKLRGNNGSKGLLSKKFDKSDFEKKIHSFICSVCGNPYQRFMKLYHTKVDRSWRKWIPLCDECCVKRKLETELEIKKQKYQELISSNRYEEITYIDLKEIVWNEQGKKCNHCGYDKYDIKKGPYELHHKDEKTRSNKRDNIEVLCRNCHAMTPNFVFRGRKHSHETIEKIKLKLSENKVNCPIT